MSNKGANLLIILVGLGTSLYGLYGVGFGNPIPIYGGHFQYLTIVGLLVTMFSFVIRILNLLTGSLKMPYESLIAIAAPVEGLISLLYWPLVLYDKSLLVPEDTVFDLSLPLDLSLHLFPTIVCWIDLMKYNTEFKRSPVHIFSIYVFAFLYFIWVNICFEKNGVWAYPILGNFKNDLQRGAFFVASAWVCSGIYKMIVKGHTVLHKQNEVKQKTN